MSHPAEILKQKNLAPLKKFGQNFLVNTHSLDTVAESLDKHLVTLEIGPGLGAVTKFLLEKNFQLHSCEIDRSFASYMQETFGERLLSIIQADFLKTDSVYWQKKNIRQVVGNLPFYITTPILQKIVKDLPFIDKAVFGVQWEFAERICGEKNNSGSNSLEIFLNSCGQTKLLAKIKRNSFYPPPAVDAAWFSWQRDTSFGYIDETEKLLRGAFWGKRKNLLNSFLKNPFWEKDEQTKKWRASLSATEQKNIPQNIRMLLQRRPDQLSAKEYQDILFFFLNGI